MNVYTKIIAAALVLTAQVTFATNLEPMVIDMVCGKVSSAYAPYGQVETEHNGEYVMRVNCELDQEERSSDPRMGIEKLGDNEKSAAGRKGWITRYNHEIAKYRAKTKSSTPRNDHAYVCMKGIFSSNPCKSKDSKALIYQVNAMTSADRETWINNYRKGILPEDTKSKVASEEN